MEKIQWHEDRPKQAYKLALLGASEIQIAEVMEVAITTIDYWKSTKKKFKEALLKGKMEADANVAESLYKRAIGYDYFEEHVSVYRGQTVITQVKKHMPPDVMAATKWLQARQRHTWTDTTKLEVTNTNINIMKLDLSGLSMEELKLVESINRKQLEAHVTRG